MSASAMLDVRVFPWRLRTRVMQARTLRDTLSNVDPSSYPFWS